MLQANLRSADARAPATQNQIALSTFRVLACRRQRAPRATGHARDFGASHGQLADQVMPALAAYNIWSRYRKGRGEAESLACGLLHAGGGKLGHEAVVAEFRAPGISTTTLSNSVCIEVLIAG